jgi:ceramide glucosyltransferase
VVIALASGQSVMAAAAAFLTLWYGAEMLLAALAGWHLPVLYPLHAMLRDAMLPFLWIEGWRASAFVWRGNAMDVNEGRVAPN